MTIGPGETTRKLVNRLAGAIYASPLYRLTLRARVPERLVRLPPPAWPGDTEHGAAVVAGRLVCAGRTIDLRRRDWYAEDLDSDAFAELHGFGWLDDLAAVGSESAQRRARELIAGWLDAERAWHPIASAPAVAGRRIASWLTHAKFVVDGADDDLGRRMLRSLTRQMRHLSRVAGSGEDGLARLIAIRGLLYGACCGIGNDRMAQRAVKLLTDEIRRQVLPDGGHVERSPASQLAALAALIDMRDMAEMAGLEVPAELPQAIARMSAMLRFLRHGDGGLALFNGANEASPALIEAVLARAAGPDTRAAAAPDMGYERLAAGTALVLPGVGRPPPAGFDRHAHAGTLSFEFSSGRERVIVNCGAMASADAAWRFAQRATAAHSTLVVDDTNSAEILTAGGIGWRPEQVTCTREEDGGNVWITASHDGYAPLFRLVHQRRLYLSRDGDDFRGEDTLTGPHVGSFAVRFHLHPDMQVSLVQNGTAALLRAPSGTAWRFLASGGKLELAETVYLGRRNEMRRSEQIVISGPISNGAQIKWALRRITKA